MAMPLCQWLFATKMLRQNIFIAFIKKIPKKFQTKLKTFNFFSLSHTNNFFLLHLLRVGYTYYKKQLQILSLRMTPTTSPRLTRTSRRTSRSLPPTTSGASTSHLPSTTHPHQLPTRVNFTSTCKVGEIQTH